MAEPRIFTALELMPEAWRDLISEAPARIFNPGLLSDGTGWILAYRVVAGASLARRIALCRLTSDLAVVPGSAVPFSDLVAFEPGHHLPAIATRWFADPRLYRLQGRVFVYWNSGWHEPRNSQFLHEVDPATLRPRGVARELQLEGERQKLEKNWTFFGEHPPLAVYSVAPHRLLALDLANTGPLRLREIDSHRWDIGNYATRFGTLRGGAPPQEHDGRLLSFCHSVRPAAEEGGHDYAAAVYRFAAAPPFRPTDAPRQPLRLLNPFGRHRCYPALNPAVSEVLYPCGAARDGGGWLVSYGINDERCALARLADAAVEEALRPLDRAASP